MMTQEVLPLDHVQDVSRAEVHRLTHLYPPPAYVKSASHEQLYGADDLPVHVHAHPAKKLYRGHSKAATWMSSLFFAENRSRLAPDEATMVEAQLRKFANYHQILPEVEALWGKVGQDQKATIDTLSDDEFALVWLGADGNKSRQYLLRNPAEVKAAAAWFERYQLEFEPEDRRQIAAKILKRAQSTGAALAETDGLYKAAGMAVSPTADIASAWYIRAGLVRGTNKVAADTAMGLAASLERCGSLLGKEPLRQKIAAEMEAFDVACGLVSKYATGELVHPQEVCFAVTEKAANEFLANHVQTLTGSLYSKEALAGLTPEKLRDWLGQDLADEVLVAGQFLDVEKLAECLPTLPRPDAVMFDQLAAAEGIYPIGKDKAAADFGFTQEQLAELATTTV